MALLTTQCPKCSAGLQSPTGFTVGQTVCCPKCEASFNVAKPAEKSQASTAGAKKKPPLKAVAVDDDEQAGRPVRDTEAQSPLWYVAFGVVCVAVIVLGYFMVQKWLDESDDLNARNDSNKNPPRDAFPPGGPKGPPFGPNGPPGVPGPKFPKQPKNKPPGGPGFVPLGGLLGGTPTLTPDERARLTAKFTTTLVGTWTADLGNGVTEDLTYTADSTFIVKLNSATPAMSSGKYMVGDLAGTKGLRIQLDTADGPRTITAVFEDGELQHPSLQKGVTGIFRKK